MAQHAARLLTADAAKPSQTTPLPFNAVMPVVDIVLDGTRRRARAKGCPGGVLRDHAMHPPSYL